MKNNFFMFFLLFFFDACAVMERLKPDHYSSQGGKSIFYPSLLHDGAQQKSVIQNSNYFSKQSIEQKNRALRIIQFHNMLKRQPGVYERNYSNQNPI